MPYDNNLQQLQQKVALKKQLEAKLNDLREQRKVFDKQVIEHRVAHRSEQEDVEKLECKSLANYFYQVNVDGFLRFADYFFDGLFADWAVGDRISESQTSVMSVRYKIEQAMNKLTSMDHAATSRLLR